MAREPKKKLLLNLVAASTDLLVRSLANVLRKQVVRVARNAQSHHRQVSSGVGAVFVCVNFVQVCESMDWCKASDALKLKVTSESGRQRVGWRAFARVRSAETGR